MGASGKGREEKAGSVGGVVKECVMEDGTEGKAKS